jgi:SAM-dependent methyltransferase
MVIAEADAPTVKSFRDPAGAVFRHQGRILRAVQPEFVPQLESFLATGAARSATASGRMVGTSRLSTAESSALAVLNDALTAANVAEKRVENAAASVFEHEKIPFAGYPYEWPAEMLHAAADLTLDLASAALDEGFGIKDATPYNVLFRGASPVFVDVLSFERRDPCDASWMAYAQFVRTFLLPLAAHKYFGMAPGEVLATHRDGLEPETVYRWTGWLRRLTPPLLGLVSLPQLLGKRGARQRNLGLYHPTPSASPEQARFILQGLLRSCRRQLHALAPSAGKQSVWTDYLTHKSLYSPEQLAQKEAFVREALEQGRSRRVLDVGANEGHFSFLAARAGASVVAIDSDPAVVGKLWLGASMDHLDVLPLVVDLVRPTPATGWRNRECESFLDRARSREGGQFDMVLMLAVLHHLLVSERIPLEDVLALVSELTHASAVIEFVAPEDPMFQRIARGREQLHAGLTVERFEKAARVRFDVARSQKIDGLNRWLYLLQKRA